MVRIRRVGGGRLETISTGHGCSRVIARQPNSAYVRLGVKRSERQSGRNFEAWSVRPRLGAKASPEFWCRVPAAAVVIDDGQ
jgi:hypothetical protein